MEALRAVTSWPVGSAAAALVVGPDRQRPGSPEVQIVGDEERVYPWASVTKLCSSLAVLVAVEEGSVSLEEAAGPPGSTVAHLLAHASGLGPLPGPALSAPGTRRIYSNYGYEVLADHVAARTGIEFTAYVREGVLDPLGMDRVRFDDSGSAAAGLGGPIGDLAALGRELLAPRLISPATLALATSVAFGGLDGVLPGFGVQRPCDWGLGPELRDGKHPHWTGATNSPRTFGHFGRSGGFLWVDPDAGVALGALSDRAFGDWATTAWPALADAVLAGLAAGHAG
jgi:CubicO group peptidase (beta-lactamase class C family)